MNKINLILGDITTANTDAIVNAANSSLLSGGGVDGAIHKAAGETLLEECKKIAPINGIRCPVGEARITSGGKLKAKYVIHTVGPRYHIDPQPQALLTNACSASLQLAMDNHCRSIAFPAISCGVYAYPIDEASKISINICRQPLYETLEIYFYLFNQGLFDAWNNALLA